MVKIRLKRMGRKKRPFYRIVVADIRTPRDGRPIEEIGYYNPLMDPPEVKLDMDKVDEWISNGAKPTKTVAGIIKKERENLENTPAETVEDTLAENEDVQEASQDIEDTELANSPEEAAADIENEVESLAAEGE